MIKYRKTSGFDGKNIQTNGKENSSRSGRFLNMLGRAFGILGNRSKPISKMTKEEFEAFSAENKRKGILMIEDGLDDKYGVNITDTFIDNYAPGEDGGPARPIGKKLRRSVNLNFDETDPNSNKFSIIEDNPPADDIWKPVGDE